VSTNSHLVVLVALCAALGACTAEEARDQPRQYLDEHTAATITAVDRPLVFARDRTDLAANARDYVTLAAAAVDRMGKVQYVLVAYSWSTADSRLSEERPPVPDSLVITADDRRLLFTGPTGTPVDAGIAEPVGAPPGPQRAPYVFRADLSVLRFLSAARHLSVQVGTSDAAPSYEIWDDGRPALAAWAATLNGER
jgi:hypothetical protein